MLGLTISARWTFTIILFISFKSNLSLITSKDEDAVVLPAVHFCWKKVVVVAGNLSVEKNKLMKNHNQGWIVYKIGDVDDGY